MDSLRDIRRNIKSIKATQQIMRTMKMVASARMKKAQQAILSSRPFAVKMGEMIASLRGELSEEFDAGSLPSRRLCLHGGNADALGLVLVSSDKGLCGAFNASLFRATAAWLRANREKKIYAFVVGKKAQDFLRRIKGINIEIVHETVGIFPKAGYVHAELLGARLMETYLGGDIFSVTAIYNEFKSLLSQKVRQEDFLPLVHDAAADSALQSADFLFEPDKEQLLEALLPRHVKAQIYRILLESQAAELAARMNAMESASGNAADMISALTLKLNRTRQAMITKELSEIVGGAEALKS